MFTPQFCIFPHKHWVKHHAVTPALFKLCSAGTDGGDPSENLSCIAVPLIHAVAPAMIEFGTDGDPSENLPCDEDKE